MKTSTGPLFAVCLALTAVTPRALACTEALWTAGATQNAAPMLWKNRDTDTLSNKAVYVAASPLSYTALIDSPDTKGDQAWAGLNDAGLGIMNSASYNVPLRKGESQDREGYIMADILRTCRSTADVERYFKQHLGPKLGAQANFGVFDAAGDVALFEVHNHGYKRLNVADMPGKYLVNTNFSRSGEPGKGAGNLRFDRATALLKDVPAQEIGPKLVFELLARDAVDALLQTPSRQQLEQMPAGTPQWVITNNTINRADTSATIVMQGRTPYEPGSPATIWVALGEPLAAIAVPLWVEARSTPALMHQGKDAPLYLESLRVQKLFRPYSERDKKQYIDLNRIANRDGTGLYAPLVRAQNDIVLATSEFLKSKPAAAQLAAFQDKMAAMAMAALQQVKGPDAVNAAGKP